MASCLYSQILSTADKYLLKSYGNLTSSIYIVGIARVVYLGVLLGTICRFLPTISVLGDKHGT